MKILPTQRKVLLAFDGSASAVHALQEAVKLSKQLGLELHALWIEEPLTPAAMFVDSGDATREKVWAKQRAERAAQYRLIQEHLHRCSAAYGVPIYSEVRTSFQPVKSILREAAAGAFALIVLGSAERPRLRYRLFGSTADWVNHRARCDVLVARRSAHFEEENKVCIQKS